MIPGVEFVEIAPVAGEAGRLGVRVEARFESHTDTGSSKGSDTAGPLRPYIAKGTPWLVAFGGGTSVWIYNGANSLVLYDVHVDQKTGVESSVYSLNGVPWLATRVPDWVERALPEAMKAKLKALRAQK